MLRFTDGIEIDTGGPARRLELEDGLYVVGQGHLIPVSNENEVVATIARLKIAGGVVATGRRAANTDEASDYVMY